MSDVVMSDVFYAKPLPTLVAVKYFKLVFI